MVFFPSSVPATCKLHTLSYSASIIKRKITARLCSRLVLSCKTRSSEKRHPRRGQVPVADGCERPSNVYRAYLFPRPTSNMIASIWPEFIRHSLRFIYQCGYTEQSRLRTILLLYLSHTTLLQRDTFSFRCSHWLIRLFYVLSGILIGRLNVRHGKDGSAFTCPRDSVFASANRRNRNCQYICTLSPLRYNAPRTAQEAI
jgi:hypothetical protein